MRSTEVTKAEEDFRGMLDGVVKSFEKTSNGGRLQGRLAEDWGKVMALKADVESGRIGGTREARTQFLQDPVLAQVSLQVRLWMTGCPWTDSTFSLAAIFSGS